MMFWVGLIVGLGVWLGVDNLAVFFLCVDVSNTSGYSNKIL